MLADIKFIVCLTNVRTSTKLPQSQTLYHVANGGHASKNHIRSIKNISFLTCVNELLF